MTPGPTIISVKVEMDILFERSEDAAAFLERDEPLRKHLHDALWETARDGGWLKSGSRTGIRSLAVSSRPEQPDPEGATE
jgi:hypothetical protein